MSGTVALSSAAHLWVWPSHGLRGPGLHTDVLVATGVKADGHREILSLDVCSAESVAGWLTLFRGLNARGLTGVTLLTSDAHSGLVAALNATLNGAAWQRCRTHRAERT